MNPATTQSAEITDYLRIALDKDFGLTIHVNILAILAVVAVVLAFLAFRHFMLRRHIPYFEIDAAEFGLGDQKIMLKVNDLDRSVAYRIWVELSTRKIGLKINLDDDVIDEIYDSWYNFFSVTRDLIKDIPAAKLRNESTRKIINLSIEVLNEGLRPHLTRWQARFRRWYAYQLEKDSEADLPPQEIQRKFPHYEDLTADMLTINARLIAYRDKMYELVTREA